MNYLLVIFLEAKLEDAIKKQRKTSWVKTMLVSGLFLGGMILGDQTHPLTSLENFVTYYHVSAEDNTVKDYRDYVTNIKINEKGRAELYFGNKKTGNFRIVNPDGTVGSTGNKIDEYIQEKKSSLKKWYETHFGQKND